MLRDGKTKKRLLIPDSGYDGIRVCGEALIFIRNKRVRHECTGVGRVTASAEGIDRGRRQPNAPNPNNRIHANK